MGVVMARKAPKEVRNVNNDQTAVIIVNRTAKKDREENFVTTLPCITRQSYYFRRFEEGANFRRQDK